MDLTDENNTNILDQIASYSQTTTENFIYLLKQEYESQKKINTLLKNEDHKSNITNIQNFIKRNSLEIDSQLNKLNNITSDLKNIIIENKHLENDENKYKTILDSKESIDIANKLRDIKKTKEEINSFLGETGIWKLNQ